MTVAAVPGECRSCHLAFQHWPRRKTSEPPGVVRERMDSVQLKFRRPSSAMGSQVICERTNLSQRPVGNQWLAITETDW